MQESLNTLVLTGVLLPCLQCILQWQLVEWRNLTVYVKDQTIVSPYNDNIICDQMTEGNSYLTFAWLWITTINTVMWTDGFIHSASYHRSIQCWYCNGTSHQYQQLSNFLFVVLHLRFISEHRAETADFDVSISVFSVALIIRKKMLQIELDIGLLSVLSCLTYFLLYQSFSVKSNSLRQPWWSDQWLKAQFQFISLFGWLAVTEVDFGHGVALQNRLMSPISRLTMVYGWCWLNTCQRNPNI